MRRACLLAALLLAGPAAAHGPVSGTGGGGGDFGSGLLHPFTAPALCMALLALGLLLGQGAGGFSARIRKGLAVYAGALLAGAALQPLLGEVNTDRLLLLCCAWAAASVAAGWRLPSSVRQSLALVTGAAAGLATGPSGMEGSAWVAPLAGALTASVLLPAWVGTVVALPQPGWVKTGVRVLGGGLAAAAMLMLLLSFAPAVPMPRA
jgi:hypothetical protein